VDRSFEEMICARVIGRDEVVNCLWLSKDNENLAPFKAVTGDAEEEEPEPEPNQVAAPADENDDDTDQDDDQDARLSDEVDDLELLRWPDQRPI
jgi:hypothetical protein